MIQIIILIPPSEYEYSVENPIMSELKIKDKTTSVRRLGVCLAVVVG